MKPQSKLDARSKQGIFVGYDRETPAYLVYFPDLHKVVKRRVVKFQSKNVAKTGWDDEEFPGNASQLNKNQATQHIQDERPISDVRVQNMKMGRNNQKESPIVVKPEEVDIDVPATPQLYIPPIFRLQGHRSSLPRA